MDFSHFTTTDFIVLGLFVISELLGMIPAVKANGVFQLLAALLQKLITKTPITTTHVEQVEVKKERAIFAKEDPK